VIRTQSSSTSSDQASCCTHPVDHDPNNLRVRTQPPSPEHSVFVSSTRQKWRYSTGVELAPTDLTGQVSPDDLRSATVGASQQMLAPVTRHARSIDWSRTGGLRHHLQFKQLGEQHRFVTFFAVAA